MSKDEKIIRTTIRVPQKLWDQAKYRTIKDHSSLQELAIKALEAYLKGGK